MQSVNESTVKTAPTREIDQLGHLLMGIIHAFAQAEEDAKIFMAKWDIKDGFWRLDYEESKEWNFCHVPLQEEGQPTRLVVPTSLQMGWIESLPHFCAASETARDVAASFIETEVGVLPSHTFIEHSTQGADCQGFDDESGEKYLLYMIKVYMDDYISLAILRTKRDLVHVANAVMTGIHDVSPHMLRMEKTPSCSKSSSRWRQCGPSTMIFWISCSM